MILIRAALFAVFAFMGSISLSAQGVWKSPAQAKEVIVTELNVLNAPPSLPTFVQGMDQEALSLQYASRNCTDCMVTRFKKEFLKMTLIKLNTGANDTGAAVQEVRARFLTAAASNAPVVAAVNTTYQYIQDKLKS